MRPSAFLKAAHSRMKVTLYGMRPSTLLRVVHSRRKVTLYSMRPSTLLRAAHSKMEAPPIRPGTSNNPLNHVMILSSLMKNTTSSVSLRPLIPQNPSKAAPIQSQPLKGLGGQEGPSHSNPHGRIPDTEHSPQPYLRLPIISKGPLGKLLIRTGPRGN